VHKPGGYVCDYKYMIGRASSDSEGFCLLELLPVLVFANIAHCGICVTGQYASLCKK
jgi:hypothetical protein